MTFPVPVNRGGINLSLKFGESTCLGARVHKYPSRKVCPRVHCRWVETHVSSACLRKTPALLSSAQYSPSPKTAQPADDCLSQESRVLSVLCKYYVTIIPCHPDWETYVSWQPPPTIGVYLVFNLSPMPVSVFLFLFVSYLLSLVVPSSLSGWSCADGFYGIVLCMW